MHTPPRCAAAYAAVSVFLSFTPAPAADFAVTATLFEANYTINGVANSPPLTLVRGKSYTFQIDACSCHPFEIVGAPPGSVLNNTTASGAITFNVPMAASSYSYHCAVHLFGGSITTIDPPVLSAIESWRQTHFGSPANTGTGADSFDADQDGMINLFEFAFGTIPTQPGSLGLPEAGVDGASYVISFARPPGVDGIIYGAEWSSNLDPGSWTPIPDTGTASQPLFAVATAGRAQLFVRLQVSTP